MHPVTISFIVLFVLGPVVLISLGIATCKAGAGSYKPPVTYPRKPKGPWDFDDDEVLVYDARTGQMWIEKQKEN